MMMNNRLKRKEKNKKNYFEKENNTRNCTHSQRVGITHTHTPPNTAASNGDGILRFVQSHSRDASASALNNMNYERRTKCSVVVVVMVFFSSHFSLHCRISWSWPTNNNNKNAKRTKSLPFIWSHSLRSVHTAKSRFLIMFCSYWHIASEQTTNEQKSTRTRNVRKMRETFARRWILCPPNCNRTAKQRSAKAKWPAMHSHDRTIEAPATDRACKTIIFCVCSSGETKPNIPNMKFICTHQW